MNEEINSALYLTRKYLEYANIYINKDDLEVNFLSHSNFPNIVSIIEVFKLLKIDFSIYEIEKNKKAIEELPNTFFTVVTSSQKKERIVIVHRKIDGLEVIFNKNLVRLISYEDFLTNWSCLVLLIDNKKSNLIYIYKKIIFNLKSIFFNSLLVISIYLFLNLNSSLYQLYHFIFSLIGLYTSYIIYLNENGHKLYNIEKFCTSFKKSNCDEVINSKGGTIIKNLKLSDLSLIYFFSLVNTTLIMKYLNYNYDTLLIILSFLGLPIILYSLFYQLWILKKWCPLCIMIASILFIQLLLTFFCIQNSKELHISSESICTFSFSLLFMYSFLRYNKKIDFIKKDLKETKIKYNKFKRNFNLFNLTLTNSKKLTPFNKEIKEIIIGNRNSNLNVTIITNPMCEQCKETHLILNKIIQEYYNDITLTVRFYLFYDDVNDIEFLISNSLLNIYESKGDKICLDKINEMFESENKDKWVLEQRKNNSDVSKVLIAEKKWCNHNLINFTPVIIINNLIFPSEQYDIDDLNFFIEDLININQIT